MKRNRDSDDDNDTEAGMFKIKMKNTFINMYNNNINLQQNISEDVSRSQKV